MSVRGKDSRPQAIVVLCWEEHPFAPQRIHCKISMWGCNEAEYAAETREIVSTICWSGIQNARKKIQTPGPKQEQSYLFPSLVEVATRTGSCF